MRWKGRRTSKNIDDRRHTSRGVSRAGMGGAGLIVVLVIGLFFGVDITPFLSGGGQVAPPQANAPVQINDETEEFVAVVLADTEVIWGEVFRDSGIQYTPPVLVLFAGNDEEKLVFEIAADRVPCVGVAPMQCLVINGDFFYESIVGYRHIDGQAAKICVLRTKRPEPIPADLGAFVFTRVPCED
ncbi:neutral zinc metallopeptidase [Ruegeria hyattellae]|uniref:neutral zinc metallopeptidase n=1 Tax=Ruegeria hyattellae TaxID=3233337 RepID=UPI0026382D52|nr:neutral zinc metallopeptidase [uncultured Ruegeria sp.]